MKRPCTVCCDCQGLDVEALDGEGEDESHSADRPTTQERHEEAGVTAADAAPDDCQREERLSVVQALGNVETGEATMLCSRTDEPDVIEQEPGGLAGHEAWGGSEELWAEPDSEELLGGSISCYFSTVETLSPSVPPTGDSSGSENESGGQLSSAAMEVGRVRTGGSAGPAGGGMKMLERQAVEEQPSKEPHAAAQTQERVRHALNICISLLIILAISLGLGQIYDEPGLELAEMVPGEDLSGVRGALSWHQQGGGSIMASKEVHEYLTGDPKQKCTWTPPSTESTDRKKKDSPQLTLQQGAFQHEAEERHTSSHPDHLSVENRQLKSLLVCEEKSVSTLQEELRNLRMQIRNLEWKGVEVRSVPPKENQDRRRFRGLRDVLIAEAQVLHRELDRERRVTGLLKEELGQLRGHIEGPWGTGDLETEMLQARLVGLEKRLSFEQRRSDLWQRLYVQDMDKRTRGDKRLRVKVPKGGVVGKVKHVFQLVKNISGELEYHHREEVKREKEDIKENQKFLDYVMTTFYNLKEMTQSFLRKKELPGLSKSLERRDVKGKHCTQRHVCSVDHAEGVSWTHKRRHLQQSFQAGRETLIPGIRVHVYAEGTAHTRTKGCSGVFDCASQEFTSLFNKALNPIQLSEFSQLIYTYLQQEVDHFHYWEELESFISSFFHNGVFIHDQMLFTDFVSGVEDYLKDIDEYKCLNKNVFEDLDRSVYRYFFGDDNSQWYAQSASA
ncbi:cell cycle progression protein 1-like isoform X2 [Brienomyrus brachyistius]|uniref:cell cycle progression protein 1-like isoform X2 n=1 Tax=Brienomyrus brachyistius TaxID=42636 RepID=UPI0020B21AC4|nr:cell cycle progression protein 1-like isoform X2 [Brienomyrus brachyistius]